MRRLLRWLAILAVLLGGSFFAAKAYLGSDRMAAKVAARLSAALGVHVTVGGVEVGMSGCAATNIAIGEADASPAAAPFLRIGRAEVDVGLSDIVTGSADPDKLVLIDAHIILRHDRDGQLVTKLPREKGGKIPEIELRQSAITLVRDGWPDCTFRGIDVMVTPAEGELIMCGTVTDPAWGGTWATSGRLPRPAGAAELDLKHPGVHITPADLQRIPFVPADVWTHFSAEGDTPVDLHLVLSPAPTPVRYRVMLEPSKTRFHVSSIDVSASEANGKVMVEDKTVSFRDIRGRAASGDFQLRSAILDFRQPTSVMSFDLEASELNLKELPGSWRLPPRLGGKLSGSAKIGVRVVDHIAISSGSGEGRVDHASIGIIPFPNYGLRIQADRNGFRFEPTIGFKAVPASKP